MTTTTTTTTTNILELFTFQACTINAVNLVVKVNNEGHINWRAKTFLTVPQLPLEEILWIVTIFTLHACAIKQ